MTTLTTPVDEARMIALSDIHLVTEFNPRDDAEHAAIDSLAQSMLHHGVLSPVLVAPDGDGAYRLIAGERRYRAAQKAGLEQLPALVRETPNSAGLDLALVENIKRKDLSPVQEAYGFKRLMDEQGLTRKGVAELLCVAQKRVTDRLQILDVPEALHGRIASGDIAPSAIKALATLARIHPDLPAVAVAHVDTTVDPHGWQEPTTWADVAADPIGVIATDYADDRALPPSVYLPGDLYPVERFSLSEGVNRDLAKYAELVQVDAAKVTVRFGSESVESARKLGAYHASKEGYAGIIVGQEVADQLAGDWISAALKARRKHQRDLKRFAREHTGTSPAASDSNQTPPSEEEVKHQRAQKRKTDEETRKSATAYNHALGAACTTHLVRIRVDERVVKLLSCVDAQGELDKIAARGARYGFPGWTQEVEQKSGRHKVVYRDPQECRKAAREFLDGAKTAAEIAGRLIALIAMARYAREEAVAMSNRTYHDIEVRDSYGRGLPWSTEVLDIIDAICAERLPDHLTKDVRAARAKARREAARVAREGRKAQRIADDAIKRVDKLDAKQRAELVAEVGPKLGDFHLERGRLRARVRELDAAEVAASDKQSADEQQPKAA